MNEFEKREAISKICGQVIDETLTVEEGYAALEKLGEKREDHNLEKLVLSETEKRQTTIGWYPDQANGWGMLDQGLGAMDKVAVRNGRLVGCDCGKMPALVFIAGRMYNVHGSVLTD